MYLKLKGAEVEPRDQDSVDEVLRKSSGAADDRDFSQLDVDSVVEGWCRKEGVPFPEDVEEKIRIHMLAMESCVNTWERNCDYEGKKIAAKRNYPGINPSRQP